MLFTCICIVHFLSVYPIPTIKIPSIAGQYLTLKKSNHKGISLFYNLLQDKQTFRKNAALQNWELDMGTTFTDDQWQLAFQTIQKSSHCVGHWEMMINVTKRWQYTPCRLARYFPNASPLCWWNCGHKGNLLHTFWYSPSLIRFWNQVFQMISLLTGIINPLTLHWQYST